MSENMTSEMEKTCLDECMIYGIRGREEDFMRTYYRNQGVSEEAIEEAIRVFDVIEGSEI